MHFIEKLCPSETEIGSGVIVRLAERMQTKETRQNQQQIRCLVFLMTLTQEWNSRQRQQQGPSWLLASTWDWYLAVPGLYLFLGCSWWCSELYSLPSRALGPLALPLCGWHYLLMISRAKGCKLRDVDLTQAPLQPPVISQGRREGWVLATTSYHLKILFHNTALYCKRLLCSPPPPNATPLWSIFTDLQAQPFTPLSSLAVIIAGCYTVSA